MINSMINRINYHLVLSRRASIFATLVILGGCLSSPPNGTKLIEDANAKESTIGSTQTSAVIQTKVDKTQADVTKIDHLSPRHSFELKLVNKMLKRFHYKKFKLDDAFAAKILDQYLDRLDPRKMYFTQADINQFNKYKNLVDDYINAGETEVAVNIFKIYQQRVKERAKFAESLIGKKLDLNTDETYNLDREEAAWAKDSKALDALWTKRIKNDYINQILAEKTPQETAKKLSKRYQNMAKRSLQIKPNDLFQTIVNAYASAIEPHTSYLSPRSSKQFDIQMSLSLSGIGAVLRTDEDYTKIVSVVPGGPADLSGKISAGDRIIGVGQKTKDSIKDIVGWRLSDVVNLIRGKKGTTVVLSILPHETGLSGKPETVSIVRDKIKLEHQAASKRIIEVDRPGSNGTEKVKVGVIKLPSFYIDFKARNRGDTDYAGTTRDVKKLLLELKKEGINDLIIDLRGNGGGSLSEVVSLTGLFIKNGPVVQINDSSGRTDILRDNNPEVVWDGPMAVMIDKGSASASEIFAGAIQDYKRGIIIGETSFGKGTVQTILPLGSYTRKSFDKPLGQLKVTTAQFFRVNGDSTQHKGVVPDISWNLPKIDADLGERAYKNALPWRHLKAVPHNDYRHFFSPTAIKQAAEKSLQRRMHTPKYVTTLNRLKLLVKAGNEKTLSLNLKKRKEKRAKFNKQLLALENELQTDDGLPAYKTIKELQDAQEKKNDDIFTKKKDIDVFLNETAHILTDLQYSNQLSAAK